jgi:WD40 repeat protein
MRSLLLSLMLAGSGLVVVFAAAPPAPVSAEVRKLIARLGDDDADVRQAAAKKLESMGEEALPALRKASKSLPDVDARLRAGVVAAAIEKKLFGEIRCFKGHTWWVFRVVVTPDGKHIVSSGDYLRLWDLQTGKEVLRFTPNARSWGLSISRDGKRLLASNADRSVRLYEIPSGKELQKFVRHTNEVWVAGLSPDGTIAVTGALDRTLHVWEAKTGKHLRAFENVTDYPRCIAFSPAGKKVAIGHSENTNWNFVPNAATVRIWDVQTGKVQRSGTGHTSAITGVVWSRDGKWIATSSFDKTVRIWDARTLKERKRLTVSTAGCDSVAFTPDARQVVTTGCGNDHAVRVWDVATGRERCRFDGHTDHALSVVVTADGKYAVSSASDATVRLWPMPQPRSTSRAKR